mmetsp:Transcript_63609/g.182991  ORF Transcript_63609/g.182991 Transcript_63609/m.182991 type:complete len:203 (+) Transcript_63609:169-777(+)
MKALGYRSPWSLLASTSSPKRLKTLGSNFRASAAAATFASRLLNFVVPGMGKTSAPWACTQARESCAGETPCSLASSSSGARRLALAAALSPERCGHMDWKPVAAPPSLPILDQSASLFTSAEVKPRQRGEYATTAMPSSRHVGTISFSRLRMSNDHSCCTAVNGWMPCAMRICDADASEIPRYLHLPSATSSFASCIHAFR